MASTSDTDAAATALMQMQSTPVNYQSLQNHLTIWRESFGSFKTGSTPFHCHESKLYQKDDAELSNAKQAAKKRRLECTGMLLCQVAEAAKEDYTHSCFLWVQHSCLASNWQCTRRILLL
jgi:hypothetical protein